MDQADTFYSCLQVKSCMGHIYTIQCIEVLLGSLFKNFMIDIQVIEILVKFEKIVLYMVNLYLVIFSEFQFSFIVICHTESQEVHVPTDLTHLFD